jgi:hypothetical protein
MVIRMSYLGITLLALVLLLPGCASRRSPELSDECADIATTGQFNVLTLNGLFDAPAVERAKSWADVDRIHTLLGTSDNARDLQRVQNERGANPYELHVACENQGLTGADHGQYDLESLPLHAALLNLPADRVRDGFRMD